MNLLENFNEVVSKINKDPEKRLNAYQSPSGTRIKRGNIILLRHLTEGVDENVFNAAKLIIKTENIIDLWIFASLIVRRKMKMNSEVEDKYLDDWKSADKENKALYKKLQHPAYMQKMLVWNELMRHELLAF